MHGTPTDPNQNLVILDDPTASHPPMTFGTSIDDDISKYSRAGGSITLITVNGHGAGAKPAYLLNHAALSDAGPRDAPSVDRIAKSMPQCIHDVLAQGAPPSAPGTDFYPAANEAAKAATTAKSTVVWLTDMAFNAGQIDLTRPGMLELTGSNAGKLAAERAPLDFHGAMLQVYGVGDTVQEVTPQGQRWLADFATSLCLAWNASGCDAITPSAVTGGIAAPGLPSDPQLPFPALTPAPVDGGCAFTIPGSLGFDGDSRALRRGFMKYLAPVIQVMTSNPTSTAVVTGHAASTSLDPGPQNVTWSRGRAEAVVAALVQAGVAPSRLTARGVGNMPRIKDMDPRTGQQIPDVVAAERWVKIMVDGVSCPQ